MRLIDGDALRGVMYHEAFETDSDMQRWDSGCWIRYKMFENAIDNAPTIDAVPVVTCESCRYSEGEPISDGRLWCDYLKTYMRYCSEGDRREETAKCQNRR